MNAQQHPMGTKPILPLLISMSLPPIVSMLIQSLYNIVDSIFVAQLSENALTAVSLAFPLQNIVKIEVSKRQVYMVYDIHLLKGG